MFKFKIVANIAIIMKCHASVEDTTFKTSKNVSRQRNIINTKTSL